MKRTLLSIFALMFFVTITNAQNKTTANITINGQDGSPIIGNAYNIIDAVNSTIPCHLQVANNSSTNMNIKVKKVHISIIPGSTNSFCWGECYVPSVYVSPDPIAVAAAATDLTSFIGDYTSNGNSGSSIIRYVFFDEANTTDTAYVDVTYATSDVLVPTDSSASVIDTCFITGVVDSAWVSDIYSNSNGVFVQWTIVHEGGTSIISVVSDVTSVGTYFFELSVNCVGKSLIHFTDTVEVRSADLVNSIENKVSLKDLFSIYPNPAKENTNIKYAISKSFASAYVKVTDMLGNKVFERDITENNGIITLSVNSLNDGIYFYSIVVDGNTSLTKKLVVRH